LAQNAKNTVLINKTKIQKIAHSPEVNSKKLHRFNALVEESRAMGVSKKVAEKNAKELIYATGEFSHKSAQKSASIFEKAGLTKAETQAIQAERKANLMNKFKQQ